MKVLLVNPYIYDFTAYDLWLKPLGLLYVAAALKKYSHCELWWLDTLDRFQENAFPQGHRKKARSGRGKFYREEVEKPEIYKDIPRTYARYGMPWQAFKDKLENLPDMDLILVTSLMTYWFQGVNVTIDALRERFPNAKIVLGGILPNLLPEDQLRSHINADLFVKGYGEAAALNLPGVTTTGKNHLNEDIDALPFPAVEFLSNRQSLPLLTSRGCPFRCTYCASNLLNKKFIQRDSGKVLEEIFYMHQTYGTREFAIFDDALLINKQNRFLKVFAEVRKSLDLHFHTPNGLHAGEIDPVTAQMFYDSGFKTLRLSFESTSEDILSRSSDKVTVKQMVQAVENLEAAGYQRKDIGVYLLFGLAGQTVKQLETALDFVAQLGVVPYLSFFTPVPGTHDFLQLQRSGKLSDPIDLYETNKLYFILRKSGLTLEEITYIKDKTSQIVESSRNPGSQSLHQ